jgi:hypothetical protein
MTDKGTRVMHMVTDAHYDAGGMTVLYGTGELHEPGSLPGGVTYREVAATEAQRVSAPVHATVTGPDRVKAEAEQRAAFEKLQTAQSQESSPAGAAPGGAAPGGDGRPQQPPAKAETAGKTTAKGT